MTLSCSPQKVGYSILMDTFVVTKLVFLYIHDRGDNAVASPRKMGYSTWMDAFVVTNLVFLSIHDRIDDDVVSPQKVGYSTLMDAFVVTNLVFLAMMVGIVTFSYRLRDVCAYKVSSICTISGANPGISVTNPVMHTARDKYLPLISSTNPVVRIQGL